MKHLTSTAAETRVNPSSVEEVASAETANCLVAIDVETCVGEDGPSTGELGGHVLCHNFINIDRYGSILRRELGMGPTSS